MAMKPISKKLNEKQKEILARKLGYDGPMNMFEEFVKSDAAMGAKYNSVIGKYMARGGVVKKFAEGGAPQKPTIGEEYETKVKEFSRLAQENYGTSWYDYYTRQIGYAQRDAGYAWRDEIRKQAETETNRLMEEAESTRKSIRDQAQKEKEETYKFLEDLEAAGQITSDQRMAEQAKISAATTKASEEAQKQYVSMMASARSYRDSGRDYALRLMEQIQTGKASPTEAYSLPEILPPPLPREPYVPETRSVAEIQAALSAEVAERNKIFDQAANLEPIPVKQAPEPTQEYLLSKSRVPRADAEAEADRILSKYNFDDPAVARTSIANIAQLYGVSNTENQLRGIYQKQNIDLGTFAKQPSTTAASGTTPSTTPSTTPTTTPSTPSTTTNVPQTTATTTPSLPAAVMPTPPTPPQVEPAKIEQGTDQLVTGQAPPAQAATIQPTTVGTAATVAETAPKEAATVETAMATPGVSTALQGVQPVTGVVSPEAQVQAQTMDPRTTAVSDLQAATGEATMVQAPAPRTVQEGEMIAGPTVDMGRVEQTLAQAQAAQGVVTDEMTVAGQLQKLTADFDANNPPTWAAGAIRSVNSVLTQRGLGASSLAGQAVVQAALESALPIAAADAKVYQDMGIQNLANRQQIAVLTAQQRAAFLGQEFDQAFQTRVTNAATISEIANINFTAEQQIALENARLTNTVNLANLSNQQALTMAEAAQIANLEMANLNNRQQAQVLNAQAFLQMDMANLANEQQTELFKAQSMVNSLLTDAAAENAARQFNASSINQVNQFYDGLTTQIKQFNAAQMNGINQFNVSQINAVAEFNATAQNARDQFNAEYRRIIDQSNVEWRRNIALSDTAAINRANEINAANAMGITTINYNNMWQEYRDSIEMAWKTSEGAMDREVQLALGVLSKNAAIESAKYAVEAEKAKALGALAAVGLDKSGLFAAGGSAILSALGGGKTGTVGTPSGPNFLDFVTSTGTWGLKESVDGVDTYFNGKNNLMIDNMTEKYYWDGQLIWEPGMPDYSGGVYAGAGEIYPDGTFSGVE